MKILIIGDEENFEEAKHKLAAHELKQADSEVDLEGDYDAIFDFQSDDSIERLELLLEQPAQVFLNTVKTSLAELHYISDLNLSSVVGFNGLKSFFNRSVTELTSLAPKNNFESVITQLGFDVEWVKDRVGMVAPRVILMIINEAYYTVQEGTATKEAIDQAMKLGTNYPHGPFEWCSMIGIQDVYETLEALYQDTGDERYKICPLLKTEYLLSNG